MDSTKSCSNLFIPEVIHKIASYQHSSSTQTSVTMYGHLAFLQSKREHLHHVQQTSHGGVTEVFPGKVVMIDVVFHQVLVRVVSESWRSEFRTTARVFSWYLKIDHRFDPLRLKLSDQVKCLETWNMADCWCLQIVLIFTSICGVFGLAMAKIFSVIQCENMPFKIFSKTITRLWYIPWEPCPLSSRKHVPHTCTSCLHRTWSTGPGLECCVSNSLQLWSD